MFSVTSVQDDGRMVESSTIGREGSLGIEALLEPRPIALGHTILQIGDSEAKAISVRAFREALSTSEALLNPHRQVRHSLHGHRTAEHGVQRAS